MFMWKSILRNQLPHHHAAFFLERSKGKRKKCSRYKKTKQYMVNFCEGFIAFVVVLNKQVNVVCFICMEGTCMHYYCEEKYV